MKRAELLEHFSEEEIETVVEPLRGVCVAFGTAMRHTMLNHKEKSEKAWADFADEVCHFLKEVDK